jgi:hypothetical protein
MPDDAARMPRPALASWVGSLLWPTELVDAEIIDLSQATALGTWTYAWFRARPGQAVVSPHPLLKRQMLRASLPVRWCDHPDLVRHGGVSAAERTLLLGDPPPLT